MMLKQIMFTAKKNHLSRNNKPGFTKQLIHLIVGLLHDSGNEKKFIINNH
jgi:hypothetical protein